MISTLAKSLTPSPTVSLDSKVKELQAKGIKVINLGIGEPDFDTPNHIQRAAVKAMKDGNTHYAQAAGLPDFRKAIIAKFAKDNNIKYDPAEIIVGLGSKILLYLTFQALVDKNDEVIIPVPAWNTFAEQVKLAGGKPVFIKLDPPFKLTAQDVKNNITKKTKVILLNSPANPTGAIIDKSELKKIADLAVKNNIFIISDEIYDRLVFKSIPISIASLNKQIRNRTITINGLSKAYAMTGWRIGFAGGPKEIISAMINIQTQIASSAVTFAQIAGVTALSGTQLPLDKMLKEFNNRREYVITRLQKINEISFTAPEGAFYVFASIEQLMGKKYKTSALWCEGLLKDFRVSVVPGEAFFYPGYFRLSFASSFNDLEIGLDRIEQFIKSNYE